MVAGLLCPSCGKFTSLEELKGQEWPEWDEYVSVEGYANPFTGELLERKECTVISCQHSCGFEEYDSRAGEFEVWLHDNGTVEPIGWRWKELLGDGRFRLVEVDTGEYSYLAFVPAGRERVGEDEAVIEPFNEDGTNLPCLPAREENGEIVVQIPVGEEL